jgi:hypothetical protein
MSPAGLALLSLNIPLSTACAQLAIASARQGQLPAGLGSTNQACNPPVSARAALIPFDRIGAVAGKQYSGDGLVVAVSPGGATLRCAFQRLNANVTVEGLWLASTTDGAKGQPFRVMARALGRAGAEPLPLSGRVAVAGQVARFIRPGLTEEYSVGVDGLRQDFVIERRLEGSGPLRLELEVAGAKAEAMADGARLVLADGGRKLVYDRLKAEDARGKALPAKLEVNSPSRLAVVLDDAAAVYPVRIDPTFSDANWISFGGDSVPDVNGPVYAAVVDSACNLYIGGAFSFAGNVRATNVAEWNGNSWLALGSGISGAVNALALSGTSLYAGGAFTNAGGVPANYIARWDGSRWSALGSGMSGTDFNGPYVSALTVSGTSLYAGGEFKMAGGVPASRIAEWNGSSWSALGSGVNYAVLALAASGPNLYAGGIFTSAGGVSANYVAQWNGSAWSALGSGMDNDVYALAVSGGTLYAGGNFTSAGSVAATNIAQWNGSTWSAVGSLISDPIIDGSYVPALNVSGTNLYAAVNAYFTYGGHGSYFAQWNGSTWSVLGWVSDSSGVDRNIYVYALAASGTNLYVGGDFTLGGVPVNNIGRWDGTYVSPLTSGLNNGVSALAVSGTTLYVGGGFTSAGGLPANGIAQWNGTSWSALGSGISVGQFGFVAALAVSGTNLYAAGAFGTAGGVSVNNIAQWNGSSWSALGSGIGIGSEARYPIYALAVSGTTLYAGGAFDSAGGVAANNIAQWDGSSWSALGSGTDGQVSALAVSGNTLYAGGNWFTTAGGVPAISIAQWDGSTWSALGSGLANNASAFPYVHALVVSGNTLYVGGFFTSAGGVPANSIAQWDGSTWSALGSGMNNWVYALAVSGNTLYAGGPFTTAGGVSANYIAQWDGSAWSALGSGMNGAVGALAVLGGNLFAGGSFTTAGTNVSAYLAEAVLAGAPPFVITTNSSFGFTNGPGQFGFDVSAPGDAGFTLVIQGSRNLVNWTPLQTNVLSGSVWHFSDPSAGVFKRRFYRVLLEQ